MLRLFLSEARTRCVRPEIKPLVLGRFFGSTAPANFSSSAPVLQGRRRSVRKADATASDSVPEEVAASVTPTPVTKPDATGPSLPPQSTATSKRKRLLAGQTQIAGDELPGPAREVASGQAKAAGEVESAKPGPPARTRSKSRAATAVTEASSAESVAVSRPPRATKVAKAAKATGQVAALGSGDAAGSAASAAPAAAKKRPQTPKEKPQSKGAAVSGRENAHLKRRAREEAEAAAMADEILAARAKEVGVAAHAEGADTDADVGAAGGAGTGGHGRGPRSSKPAGVTIAAPSLFGADLHGRSMPAYLDESRWGSMAAAGVHSSLLGKLSARFGFNKATPVQAAAFEVITRSLERCPDGPSRYDAVIHSETGSGKTLAYLLPLLSWLLESTPSAAALHHARTRIIIVTPTRELAHQVYSVAETVCRAGARRGAAAESWAAGVRAAEGKKAKKSAKGSDGAGAVGRSELSAPPAVGSVSSASLLRVAKFVGEVPQSVLREANEGGAAPHIIVGTPATLAKLIPARINAGQLSAIVLDEGDELVRNHSIAAVTSIVSWASKLKHRPAVIAVSATPSHGLSSFLAKHARAASLRTINMLQSAAAAAAAAVAAGKKPRGAVSLAAAVRADAAAEASQAAALAAVEAETGATAAADGAVVPAAGATVTSDAASAAADGAPGSSSAAVAPAEDPSFYLSRAALRLALPPTLTHLLLPVGGAKDTFPTFTRWLAAAKPQAVLSFHNSVESLEATELFLRQRNVRARVLGSAYDVAQRHASIEDVKSGRAQVLLATEMAARGLDIPRLSHVLNFDPPANAREYVHRAGRVGRLSSTTPNRRGVVVTMTVGEQQYASAVRMLRDELGLATAPPLAVKAGAEAVAPDAASPTGAPPAAAAEAEALAATAAAAISSPAPKLLRLAPLMRADCVRGELQLSFIE